MSCRTHTATKKRSFVWVAAPVLTLSLVFLQEGFTYYISFQMLALATVALLIIAMVPAIKTKWHFLITFLAFSWSMAVTAINSPAVIAANSSNIAITVIGILAYAAMIGFLPYLRMKHTTQVLRVCRSVSSATIVVLAALMAVSESGLIPFLDRDAMISQNGRLIDNFTDAETLAANAALRLLTNEVDRIDLFYGEPSYLAIVLFTCLGSYILTSRLLPASVKKEKFRGKIARFLSGEMITLMGVMCLLYIKSFSSIIYALIVIYFVFVKGNIKRANMLKSVMLLSLIAIAFFAFSYEYFLYRIMQSDSVSFTQRFGFIFDYGVKTVLMGIKDDSILPFVGIHNGLFYIIAVAGLGGILYLISLFRSVYDLSLHLKGYIFWALLLLAIIMQNGGIFSPNKVVLVSLVLLPLACARSIYTRGSHENRRPGTNTEQLAPVASGFNTSVQGRAF